MLGFLGLLTFLATQADFLSDISVTLFDNSEAVEDVLELLVRHQNYPAGPCTCQHIAPTPA